MLLNYSIKNKIIIIILTIAAISSFIGNIISYAYEVSNSKKQLIANTILQAKLISESCWAPMEFNYPSTAEKVLKQLHTIPAILDGILYTSNDSVFAAYHKSADHVHEIPEKLKVNDYVFEGDYLHVKEAVASREVNYGYIYIRTKIDWDYIMNRRLYMSFAIIALMLLMVFVLAYHMQKSISGPIVQLTNQMNKVAETNDYTIQFQYNANDEIGKLYQGFNSMLTEINKAELKLKKAFQSLKESELKWQFAIEGAGDGLWDWNIETSKVFITSNWKSMLGYRDDEIDNNSIDWIKLIHAGDYKKSLRELEKHFKGESEIYINEYRLLCNDGTYKWILARGKVIEWADNKKPLRFIATHTDITNRKNAEEELRQHRDELERLVELRTIELKNATLVAEKANKAKSSFLANMSHEIRTPMNAILGYSSILIDHDTLDVKQLEYLTSINRSGHHLLAIINDILDISKIEAGKIAIYAHVFNFQLLINDLKSIFELKADEKSLAFNVAVNPSIPKHMIADEIKIRQILTNLLSNAFKFTDNGKIDLDIDLHHQKENYITAVVTDTGVGIKIEHIDKIFEPFDRGIDDIAREGTGLGLAIARNLARLMDGEITVKSEYGSGSKFAFVFPWQKKTEDIKTKDEFKTIIKADEVRQTEEKEDKFYILEKIKKGIELLPESIKEKIHYAANIGYRKELLIQLDAIDEFNKELADYLKALVKKMKFNEISNLTKKDENQKL